MAVENHDMLFEPMGENPTPLSLAVKAGMELAPGIVAFSLLYVNQLMGYYSRSGMRKGLSVPEVVEDVTTLPMFELAITGALIAQIAHWVTHTHRKH